MTRQQWLSGSQDLTPGSAFNLVPEAGRIIGVVASAGGVDGKLPDARRYGQGGGPICYVLNRHATNSINIVDQSDAVITSLAAGDAATVLLFDNTTADGDWEVIVRTILT
jgi:hypothetical protein